MTEVNCPKCEEKEIKIITCSKCKKQFRETFLSNIYSRQQMTDFMFLNMPMTTDKHYKHIYKKLWTDEGDYIDLCSDDLEQLIKFYWNDDLHNEYDEEIPNYLKACVGEVDIVENI